jgi:DNA-binding NarL/FixJ family response regulator
VLGLVAALCAALPETQALIIASLDEATLVRSAVRAGARAALLRPYTRTRVDETLRSLSPESEKPL